MREKNCLMGWPGALRKASSALKEKKIRDQAGVREGAIEPLSLTCCRKKRELCQGKGSGRGGWVLGVFLGWGGGVGWGGGCWWGW